MSQTPMKPNQASPIKFEIEDIIHLMELKSLDISGLSTINISKEEFYAIIQFIADSFNDMNEIANKYQEISDHFDIPSLHDEDGIRFGNCSKLLIKLTDSKNIDKLKSAMSLAPIFKKYVDINNFIKDNQIK